MHGSPLEGSDCADPSATGASTEAGIDTLGAERTLVGPHPGDAAFSLDRLLVARQAKQRLFGKSIPPVRVGRYVLLHRLGAGGMGVVFAAFDETLARKVAVKFIHGDRAMAETTRRRFLREARAMARLSHPNVVQIYEAGETSGASEGSAAHLFIALELVEGTTLRAWLEAERDTLDWREVTTAFRAVGQGLAAAHAAGIVHRDFKPDNVLRTAAGELKVADFGLSGIESSERRTDTDAMPEDMSITTTGAVMGTPLYMAPEQHTGREVDARSDQFAFCVALFSALYGIAPFEGESSIEIGSAVLENRRRSVPHGRVPVRVRRVVDRGLAIDPSARWPDMSTLLTALDRLLPPRSRWVWRGVAGLAFAAAAAVPSLRTTDAAPDPCAQAGEEIHAITVDAARTSLDPDSAAAVNAFTIAWAAARREGCDAHRAGSISAELYDRRQLCLDAALARTKAGLALVADYSQVGTAPASLQPASVDVCTDHVRLTAGVAGAQRAQWIAAREGLSRAEASLGIGRTNDASVALDAVESMQGSDAEAIAEAKWLRGRLHQASHEPDLALSALLEAAGLADRIGNDEVRGRALLDAVWVLGVELYRADEAERTAILAEAALARSSARSDLKARLHEALGMTAMIAGDLDEAATQLRDALALAPAGHDAQHAALHTNLASVDLRRGDASGAVEQYRSALELLERAVGPEHVSVATVLNNLGVALGEAGRHEEALEIHRRSLAQRETLYGGDSLEAANGLNGVGIALVELRRTPEAVPLLERSLAIRETTGGRPEDLAEARFALARALATDDSRRAEELAARALDTYRSPALAGAFEREAAAVSAWRQTLGAKR